jgi:hypothetical protein
MHYLFGCWLVNKAIIVQVSTYVDKFGSNLPKVPRSTHTLIQFWGPGTTQSSMTIGSFMDRVNISTQVDDVETGSSIPRYYNFLIPPLPPKLGVVSANPKHECFPAVPFSIQNSLLKIEASDLSQEYFLESVCCVGQLMRVRAYRSTISPCPCLQRYLGAGNGALQAAHRPLCIPIAYILAV